MMAFPINLTNVVSGLTEIKAEHINNLEAKVGIDGSAVVTSLDYLLTNPASANPGHTHTLAQGATDVTFSVEALNLLTLVGLTAGWVLRATGETTAAWGAIAAGDLPTGIDAVKIANGSVGNEEFQYLANVTSDLQSQLNARLTTGTYQSAASIDPGHIHSKLFASDGSPEAATVDAVGNVGLNASSFGTSAANVLALGNGTAPSTSPADCVQLWSADRGGLAGKAGLHLRSEDGTSHVFSDRIGIGTTSPTQPIDIRKTVDFAAEGDVDVLYMNVGNTGTNATAPRWMSGISLYLTNAALASSSGANDLLAFYMDAVNTGDCRALYGSYVACRHNAANTLPTLWSNTNHCMVDNGGTITDGVAVGAYVSASGPGSTITGACGVYVTASEVSGGSIGTMYGVYVGALAGTTKYGFYSASVYAINYFAGNVGLGITSFGTSATKTLSIGLGTAPSTSPADSVQLYANDRGGSAGKTGLFIRSEDGTTHVLSDRVGFGTTSPAYQVSIVGTGASGRLQITGAATGYTHADIILQTSTGDTPTSRGLGVFHFNEGNDTIWFAGNPYGQADTFVLCRKASAMFDQETANVTNWLFMVDANGNCGLGVKTWGTNATKTLAIVNGTAPASSPADAVQIYSADQAAGNACLHTRTENGTVIKLFQGAAITTKVDTISHTEPGATDYAMQNMTNSSPYGFVTQNEANSLLKVVRNLQIRVYELEIRLQAHGLLAAA